MRITINPLKSEARWIGTRAQLEAEGIIPSDQPWPDGNKSAYWKVGDTCYTLRQMTTGEALWRLYSWHHDGNSLRRLIQAKLIEVRKIADSGGVEWSANWERHLKVRRDDAFQEFKRNLLGLKRRGRKPITKPHIHE